MAVRILPFPVTDADIARLDAIQHAHGEAIDAGDLLAVFHSNVQSPSRAVRPGAEHGLIETIEVWREVSDIRSYAHAKPEACTTPVATISR